ncbi:MAG: hypothetical protein V1779_09940 [bacterium]
MTNKELIDWCNSYLTGNDYFVFPDEVFDNLTEANTKVLIENFGSRYLVKMPKSEIDFFEWLKINDNPVWNDLWNSEEEPYIIAVNFLPILMSKIRGFPICDLLNNDNYYFTEAHLFTDESKIMVDSVKEMYIDHKQLTIEQALVLEISIEPIDIWRFAYRYQISVERAKNAVNNLVKDKVLIHIKDVEQLSGFIEF